MIDYWLQKQFPIESLFRNLSLWIISKNLCALIQRSDFFDVLTAINLIGVGWNVSNFEMLTYFDFSRHRIRKNICICGRISCTRTAWPIPHWSSEFQSDFHVCLVFILADGWSYKITIKCNYWKEKLFLFLISFAWAFTTIFVFLFMTFSFIVVFDHWNTNDMNKMKQGKKRKKEN